MFLDIQEKCVLGLVKEIVSKNLNDSFTERLLKAHRELTNRPT